MYAWKSVRKENLQDIWTIGWRYRGNVKSLTILKSHQTVQLDNLTHLNNKTYIEKQIKYNT